MANGIDIEKSISFGKKELKFLKDLEIKEIEELIETKKGSSFKLINENITQEKLEETAKAKPEEQKTQAEKFMEKPLEIKDEEEEKKEVFPEGEPNICELCQKPITRNDWLKKGKEDGLSELVLLSAKRFHLCDCGNAPGAKICKRIKTETREEPTTWMEKNFNGKLPNQGEIREKLKRIQALETKGITTSGAQGIIEAEEIWSGFNTKNSQDTKEE